MRPFDQAMLDELVRLKDWPRVALYLAWHGRLEDRPGFWDDMTSNHLTQTWSAELKRSYADDAREWLLSDFRRQRREGLFHGEQNTGTYRPFHVSGPVVCRRAALERSDAEMVAECDLQLQAFLGLQDLLGCPADAHRNVALRSFGPGFRSGDPLGADLRSDVTRLRLRGTPLPEKWHVPTDRWTAPQRQTWMEVDLVADALEEGWLDRIGGGFLPRLRFPLTVERRRHGHVASVEEYDVRPGSGGHPVWSVWVDYRTGAIGSVAWPEVQPNGKRAAKMGGGKAPRQPDPPDLGDVVLRLTLDQETPLPADRPEPPPPPTDTIKVPQLADGGELRVKVRPDLLLEVIP